MEYEKNRKKWQINTWIEKDITCVNLTRDKYNALAAIIVYVNNDATIPVNSITRQMNNVATKINLRWARVNGAEIVLKSTDGRSSLALCLHVQGLYPGCFTILISRVTRLNCFDSSLYISLSRGLWNNDDINHNNILYICILMWQKRVAPCMSITIVSRIGMAKLSIPLYAIMIIDTK